MNNLCRESGSDLPSHNFFALFEDDEKRQNQAAQLKRSRGQRVEHDCEVNH